LLKHETATAAKLSEFRTDLLRVVGADYILLVIVLHTRSEIIALLRGQVACPIIANLAEFGWLDQMCEGSFSVASFPEARATVTGSIFKYLASIGLLFEQRENPGTYVVSDSGRLVFARYGCFCILNSYEDFFQDLRSLLFIRDVNRKPAVNRMRNVFGSGHLHSRKFFSRALETVTGQSFPFLVDLGCGNGQFLQQAIEAQVAKRIGGVDVSKIALATTARNISEASPGVCLHLVEADASKVQIWSQQMPWHDEAGLFSCWFVLHEFSQHDPEIILEFLRQVNSRYPLAELVIGELVRLPHPILASNKAESIMPEFLLFHELSGQGVLSWTEWQKVRKAMPFHVVAEHHIDNVLVAAGRSAPSSFIWHLRPG
jgi:SAM-dependent methyltransferase